jgi:hypothetical protein
MFNHQSNLKLDVPRVIKQKRSEVPFGNTPTVLITCPDWERSEERLCWRGPVAIHYAMPYKFRDESDSEVFRPVKIRSVVSCVDALDCGKWIFKFRRIAPPPSSMYK